MDLIQRLMILEEDILYQDLPSANEPEFLHLPGNLPVLFSAPHGAEHTRNGLTKGEDEFTAGFARLAAEMAGAHVLFARRKSTTDPNYYDDVPYKETLREVVRQFRIGFILDIHGAHASRSFGIELGTMNGQSCPPPFQSRIIQAFLQRGFYLAQTETASENHTKNLDWLNINTHFTAGRQRTVTRFASLELGIYAAQFELNAHLRTAVRRLDAFKKKPFQGDLARIERTLLAFTDLAQSLAEDFSRA